MNNIKESTIILGIVQPIRKCRRKLFMSGVNKYQCAFNKSSGNYCKKCMPCMMQKARFERHAELLTKEKELYLQMWNIIKNIVIEHLTAEYWEDIKLTRNYLIELNESYVIEEDQQTVQTLKNAAIFMGDYAFLRILQKNKNYFKSE